MKPLQPLILLLIVSACSEINSLAVSGVVCADAKPSKTPPSSVHSLRPGDVSVVSALGLSRSEESGVLSGLFDILSTFNPTMTTFQLENERSLLEQVDDLIPFLKKDQWKLLLLFVPVDELCICSDQASAAVDSAVQRVEQALDKLHAQLDRTLVHVVVWGGKDLRSCECSSEETHTWNTFEKATLMTVLQESLSALLQRRQWWKTQNNFTVVLQSTPTNLDASTDSAEKGESDSVNQLWTKLGRPYLYTHHNSPSQQSSYELTHVNLLPTVLTGTTLPCLDKSPSPSVPASVHALRPADISVVGAIGDSLTAGNGIAAITLLGVLNEYRGLSWSIGGDSSLSSVTTLANILREFNPSLTGFSTGSGKASSTRAFLNQAVAGAKSEDLASQARALITRMKSDSRIDFQSDWKVITVFIGGNDLCAYCSNTAYYSATNFANRIQEALDIFHDEVPRALVNLVEPLYIIPLRELHQDSSLGCPTWLVNNMCSCVVNPAEGSPELQALKDINREYQSQTRDLINSGRYNNRSDFSVVLQPFFRDVVVPRLSDGRPDRSFFAPDCFHLSEKSQTFMARALWNNMLEPLSSKTSSLDFNAGVSVECPSTNSPYFATSGNSEDTYKAAPRTAFSVSNWGSDFACTDTSPSDTVPTSVHRLRPGDINVVASLGDSITAGFGAKATNIIQLMNEERGVSWSIGGDDTLESVTTLPNILKKFNPNIYGFSKGRSKRPNGFNMAVSGAKAMDIPEQVTDLIEALRNDTNVDFKRDWKLVTLFIGGNDLCQYCNDQVSLSPKKYIGHIRNALDILYREVPRVLVNLVEILQIEDLRMIKSNATGCALLQPNLCPCFIQPEENSDQLYLMKRINRELQTETERLVFGGRYDGRKDFAIVLQPFFQNSVIPMGTDKTPDLSFFSVDCFHFSERGHAEMAIALWNNMLEPVGSKQVYNNFTHDRLKVQCPTKENPYFFTVVNSHDPETTQPDSHDSDHVSTWLAPVLAVSGFLIGSLVTWFILYCRGRSQKRKKREQSGRVSAVIKGAKL